jgi:hypothetical protein
VKTPRIRLTHRPAARLPPVGHAVPEVVDVAIDGARPGAERRRDVERSGYGGDQIIAVSRRPSRATKLAKAIDDNAFDQCVVTQVQPTHNVAQTVQRRDQLRTRRIGAVFRDERTDVVSGQNIAFRCGTAARDRIDRSRASYPIVRASGPSGRWRRWAQAARSMVRTAKARQTTANRPNAAVSIRTTAGAPMPSRLKRNRSTCHVIGLSHAAPRNHAGSSAVG